MKFNRQALISAVDNALAADRARWEARHHKEVEEYSSRVALWMQEHSQRWMDAGLAVRRAVRAGQPVTKDMLPQGRYRDVALFVPDGHLDRAYQPPQELLTLRALLDTIVDEEISSTGLEAVGITSRIMREAALHMMPGTVRV